jgi:hypothetical protein
MSERPVSTQGTPKKGPRPGSRKAQQEATATRQAQFLQAYVTVGTIRGACVQTGVGRRTHYGWLERSRRAR